MFLLEDGRLYTLLANAYPSACTPYTQTRIPALSVATHKCVFCQIWVKFLFGYNPHFATHVRKLVWCKNYIFHVFIFFFKYIFVHLSMMKRRQAWKHSTQTLFLPV